VGLWVILMTIIIHSVKLPFCDKNSLPSGLEDGSELKLSMSVSTLMSVNSGFMLYITQNHEASLFSTALSVLNSSHIMPFLKWFPLKLSELSAGSRRRPGNEFDEVGLATEKARRAASQIKRNKEHIRNT